MLHIDLELAAVCMSNTDPGAKFRGHAGKHAVNISTVHWLEIGLGSNLQRKQRTSVAAACAVAIASAAVAEGVVIELLEVKLVTAIGTPARYTAQESRIASLHAQEQSGAMRLDA